MTFRPGKRSSVPSKIRCESAIVVSSGLPMVLPSQPLPDRRLPSSGTPCGWMKSGTPSSSALAQTGWSLGSENSMPATWPPIAAPFRPCFLTAVSSSMTARSGACRVSEAKAANRSGLDAQSSASFSFWILTIWPASSRSLPYQKGLIDSTSMSTACASITFSRLSISMKASSAPLTDGTCTAAASAPRSAPASRKWQCEWMSMVFTRLPLMLIGSERAPACWECAVFSSAQLQKTTPVLRNARRVDISSLRCQGPLAHWITGDAAVPHHARLGHVPGRGLVQQAAIVPDHRVARRPVMVVGARAPAGGFDEAFQEALGLGLVHARDIVSMAADQQRLAAGLGMDLHQRPKRHRPAMETVAAIFAVGFLCLVAEFGLAVVQRVVGGKAFDLGACGGIERVICRAHVGPPGAAADRRHDFGAEHRALGLHGHVGRIGMPAHVAFQHFHHVVVVFFHAQRAVRFYIADRRHLEFERPETPGEGDLLVTLEVLAGENEQRVLQPGGKELAPDHLVEVAQLDPRHHRAEGGVDGPDRQSACHVRFLRGLDYT